MAMLSPLIGTSLRQKCRGRQIKNLAMLFKLVPIKGLQHSHFFKNLRARQQHRNFSEFFFYVLQAGSPL
jgi:hypothetical protein